MIPLQALVSARSARALRLQSHLEWIASGAAWPAPPWHRRAGAPTVDAAYIEPHVIGWDGGRPPSPEDEMRQSARGERDFGERKRQAWGQVWPKLWRAVVLGRPGEGKSTLLRHTCRQLARLGLSQLREQRVGLDTIHVPIWLPATRLVQAGTIGAVITEVNVQVDQTSAERAPITPPDGLTPVDLEALRTAPVTWLFIDALDERPLEAEDERAAASRSVHALGTLASVRGHVILSVREYAWHPEHLPFLTTMEPARGGLAVYQLAPLDQRQRFEVLLRWHPRGVADDRGARLIQLLNASPISELTSNALLLTLLCAAALVRHRVIDRHTRRAELYAWLVEDVVAREDKLHLSPAHDVVQERVAVLEQAAWALWNVTRGAAFPYQLWTTAVADASATRPTAGRSQDIVRDVAAAGLLIVEGSNRRFFPQTVFEYLAAAGLVQRTTLVAPGAERPELFEEVARCLATHAHEDAWRELCKLAIGHQAAVRRRHDVAAVTVVQTLATSGTHKADVAAMLGEAIVEAGHRDQRLAETVLGLPGTASAVLAGVPHAELVEALHQTMRNVDAVGTPISSGAPGHLGAALRVRAGTALGWVGDPRFDPSAHWLPVSTNDDPLRGFVFIPGGVFTMGTEEGNDGKREVPRRLERVPSFLMARWHVTGAQWSAFLEATGRRAAEWPDFLKAASRLMNQDAPSFWDRPMAPARYLRVEEMLDYCRWLSGELAAGALAELGRAMSFRLRTSHLVVRMPTEVEWEYVAKGGDASRRYPYGRIFNPDAGNGAETGIRTATPVGCFAQGRTPEGIEDLSGNVYELTLSSWYRYNGNEPTFDDASVTRGGSFASGPLNLRSTARDLHDSIRDEITGFRLVVAHA